MSSPVSKILSWTFAISSCTTTWTKDHLIISITPIKGKVIKHLAYNSFNSAESKQLSVDEILNFSNDQLRAELEKVSTFMFTND